MKSSIYLYSFFFLLKTRSLVFTWWFSEHGDLSGSEDGIKMLVLEDEI